MFILIFWISSFLFILYLFKEIISPKKSIPMFKKISNDFFYSFVIFAFLLFFLIIIMSITQLFILFLKFVDNVILLLYIISFIFILFIFFFFFISFLSIISFSLILILLLYFLITYLIKNTLFIVNTVILLKNKKTKNYKSQISLIILAVISIIILPILTFAFYYSSLISFAEIPESSESYDDITFIDYIYYSTTVSHSLSLPDDNVSNTIQEKINKNNLMKIIPSFQVISQKLIDIFFLGFIATIITNVFWKSLNNNKISNSINSSQLNQLNHFDHLFEITKLERLLTIFHDNSDNNNQDFWQATLSENASILSQVFSIPILDFQKATYISGKNIRNDNTKITDYISQNNLINNFALIGIKNPNFKLLHKEYNSEDFSISTELTEQIIQILEYKEQVINDYAQLKTNNINEFYAFNPQCILIVGNLETLDDYERKSFELYRKEMNNVIIITYDELFKKVEALHDLLIYNTLKKHF